MLCGLVDLKGLIIKQKKGFRNLKCKSKIGSWDKDSLIALIGYSNYKGPCCC